MLVQRVYTVAIWFLPCQVKIGTLTFVVTEIFDNPVGTKFALQNVL